MKLAIQNEGDFDALATLARAELERMALDLAEQREPVRTEPPGGSLASLVAARDEHMWATIDSGGLTHE